MFKIAALDKAVVVRYSDASGFQEVVISAGSEQTFDAPSVKVAVLGLVNQPDMESPNGPGGE